jgi:hypothetical protein
MTMIFSMSGRTANLAIFEGTDAYTPYDCGQRYALVAVGASYTGTAVILLSGNDPTPLHDLLNQVADCPEAFEQAMSVARKRECMDRLAREGLTKRQRAFLEVVRDADGEDYSVVRSAYAKRLGLNPGRPFDRRRIRQELIRVRSQLRELGLVAIDPEGQKLILTAAGRSQVASLGYGTPGVEKLQAVQQ